MIPKTIHYCWFGKAEKSDAIENCIKSWRVHCPEFTIKEWNEDNFDVEKFPFPKRMYDERRWAFVADYVRLYALEKEGGVYLDTDMLIVKPLDPLLQNSCVLGEEAPGVISAGMIAAIPHHPFIKECKEFYDTKSHELVTIPRALTEVYRLHEEKKGLLVLPPPAFYPFDAATINKFHGQRMGTETYGVHLWHYSWGHPINKFFKKIGIYQYGKRIVETLGIKNTLKKLLGFI